MASRSKASKYKGRRPEASSTPATETQQPFIPDQHKYPVLSLRYLVGGWGFDPCPNDKHATDFLIKWSKRSTFTWVELLTHPRHGLGSEKIPVSQIKPTIPRKFENESHLLVFRHHGNLPFAGVKVAGVFYLLWVEHTYGDLYDHG